MAEVQLLDSLVCQIAKARQARATRLESRKGLGQVVLGEIVVA